MQNPPHLGELIRESMDEAGWTVTETAARLGCERGTLSRLLNGRTGLSANMAIALEDIGWGTADHWMRTQAAYELAQARREQLGRSMKGRTPADTFIRGLPKPKTPTEEKMKKQPDPKPRRGQHLSNDDLTHTSCVWFLQQNNVRLFFSKHSISSNHRRS